MVVTVAIGYIYLEFLVYRVQNAHLQGVERSILATVFMKAGVDENTERVQTDP